MTTGLLPYQWVLGLTVLCVLADAVTTYVAVGRGAHERNWLVLVPIMLLGPGLGLALTHGGTVALLLIFPPPAWALGLLTFFSARAFFINCKNIRALRKGR